MLISLCCGRCGLVFGCVFVCCLCLLGCCGLLLYLIVLDRCFGLGFVFCFV